MHRKVCHACDGVMNAAGVNCMACKPAFSLAKWDADLVRILPLVSAAWSLTGTKANQIIVWRFVQVSFDESIIDSCWGSVS